MDGQIGETPVTFNPNNNVSSEAVHLQDEIP